METWINETWWSLRGGEHCSSSTPRMDGISRAATQIPKVTSIAARRLKKFLLVLGAWCFLIHRSCGRAGAPNEQVHQRPNALGYCFLKQHFFTRLPPASLRGAAAICCLADALVRRGHCIGCFVYSVRVCATVPR